MNKSSIEKVKIVVGYVKPSFLKKKKKRAFYYSA